MGNNKPIIFCFSHTYLILPGKEPIDELGHPEPGLLDVPRRVLQVTHDPLGDVHLQELPSILALPALLALFRRDFIRLINEVEDSKRRNSEGNKIKGTQMFCWRGGKREVPVF